MAFYVLTAPENGAIPVLVEVPHAGLAIPDLVRGEICAPPDAILRDADGYVDKLYADAPGRGATMLVARVSRYVVDLNRAPDDVDVETVPDHPSPRGVQPRGVVWRMTTDGRSVLTQPLSHDQFRRRIEAFHAPYHDTLREQLGRLRGVFGHAVLLAAHSMPSVGRSGHVDPGGRRADVVPGSQGRTTADPRVIELVDAHFREAGLTVRHDDPYRGGWTTAHYGRPRDGWHAIQVELNRALYVDEATGEPKRGDFERLQDLCANLVTRLGALEL
ncbi:MAG: N-formylglutamate amidohydrolase [Myxococcota bacterium]